ncbi:MAG: hypothetical protein FWG19_01925 [Methanomassiliicoccaceae archaeon]|nr:hypothetical protein [Methanomassiliicoccaceae archaeon]
MPLEKEISAGESKKLEMKAELPEDYQKFLKRIGISGPGDKRGWNRLHRHVLQRERKDARENGRYGLFIKH